MKRIVFALALVALGTTACKKADQAGQAADTAAMAADTTKMAGDSTHQMAPGDTTKH